MMFGRTIESPRRLAPTLLIAAGLALAAGPAEAGKAVAANEPTAVVPLSVIYPGQTLDASLLTEVDVTNPNVRNDYVHKVADLAGMVAIRTLIPGHVIPVSSVREPYAVERGKPVRLVYKDGALTISATGMPLQNAAIGEFIRVRNIESGVTVSGTVAANGTVEVAAR
jgi:flagella basal body P-ring formation protein FlgA